METYKSNQQKYEGASFQSFMSLSANEVCNYQTTFVTFYLFRRSGIRE